MNQWIKTKYEGVYLNAKSPKDSIKKYAYCVQWKGTPVWRSGYPKPTDARDARVIERANLMKNDGKVEPRRSPITTFEKMVEGLIKTGDVRKSMSKTNRPRYSVLYTDGKDYSLFNLCFEYLRTCNRKHFVSGTSIVDFAGWMRQSGRSERTLVMCLRLLHKLYGLAVARELYRVNPVFEAKSNEVLASRIRRRPQPRKFPNMRQPISDEDKISICDVVKQWRDPRAIWIGLNVWMGLRPSVFNRLRFEDFSPSEGLLYIRPEVHKSKFFKEAGTPSNSYLPDEVYELLEVYAKHIGFQFSRERGFIDEHGQPAKGTFLLRAKERSNMRQTWNRVLKKAGVKYVAPFSARHNMIGELQSASVKDREIATHSGNTPETIARYYTKPSTKEQIQSIGEKMRTWRGARKAA
ncbi:MAG: hypothetical protein A3G34_01865 [Candidatus Lindowbacteria bacterium RIFCSPLOWO2_12_FULL_62_27]|nr:MAG: hypothetical protein A3I06_05810 [Candidatus Lindowbacteria bacterium RIFCSPLOWO2_02_FULL_62_12]OGH59055.1 MAG: hypothetical protein A3G34_01865 [Candidatus Lindowbacteria bacterium RIFCSPLOWO2_12_FULL_62_27]